MLFQNVRRLDTKVYKFYLRNIGRGQVKSGQYLITTVDVSMLNKTWLSDETLVTQ